MNTKRMMRTGIVGLGLLLAACGGGGGDNSGTNPPPPPPLPQNKLPSASAGLDIAVREAEGAVLDGSASGDSDGTVASYAWTASGDVALVIDNAGAAQASFAAPDVAVDTTVQIQLEVTDNKGGKATDTLDAIIFHHVEGNIPPVPVAAPVPDAAPGAFIVLDGSGSNDGDDGSVTSYQWVQLAGLAVELSGADSAIATFQVPVAAAQQQKAGNAAEGTFIFRLFVTDDRGERNALDVPVIVKPAGDQPPVANAGTDQTVNAGDTVSLDGSDSSDTETDALQFAWVQTEGNDTLTVTLDDAASAAPSFTLPAEVAEETTLVFELTVTDGAQQAATDSVAITVRPLIADNQLPVAVAEGPVGPVAENAEVLLDGSASHDPDNDDGLASFQWAQIGPGPVITLDDADANVAHFVAPAVAEDTTLTFRLTVTDNLGAVASTTVSVAIVDGNNSPVAVAKANGNIEGIEVLEGATVVLDGRDSSDPDGDPLTYTWRAEDESLTLTPDPLLPGVARVALTGITNDTDHNFMLTVSDGSFEDTDYVSVFVRANRPPANVNAGADRSVNAGEHVALQGIGNDPESGPLTIAWTQVAAVGVPTVTLTGADTFTPSFTALADISEATTFTFRLTVTDNHQQSTTDDVSIVVVPLVPDNVPPVAIAANVTADENSVVTLDGRESNDPDDEDAALRFAWTQFEIPDGEQPLDLVGADTAQPSFAVGPYAADKIFKFQLIVADAQEAVSVAKVVIVTVRDTGPDVVPDEMVFEPLTGVELREWTGSNFVTVTGIDTPVTVRTRGDTADLFGATISVKRAAGGTDSFVNGTLFSGDQVSLAVNFEVGALGQTTTRRLIFGDLEAPDYETTWTVTAKTDGDQSPAELSFEFPDVGDLAPGEVYETDLMQPDGFDTIAPVNVLAGNSSVQQAVSPSNTVISSIRPGERFKVRIRPITGMYENQGLVTINIGGASTNFTFTTRAKDEQPTFSRDPIPDIVDVEPETRASSLVFELSEFDGPLTATVSGPAAADARIQFQTAAGNPSSELTSATMHPGMRMWLLMTSPPFDPDGRVASHLATLTVGEETRTFTVSTRAPDRIPGAFTISPKTDVAVGASVRSDAFTVPGIEVPVPVEISAHSENTAATLLRNGTGIANGDLVGPADELVIELTTPEATDTDVSATVTVGLAGLEGGQQSATFMATTAPVDTTPDDFDFTPVTGASQGELIESLSVVIQGITVDETAAVSISGDTDAAYAIQRAGELAFGEFTTAAGTIGNDDQVKVRVRAAEDFDTSTHAVIDIGGRFKTFTVTSELDAEAPQVEITFPVNGAMFNAEVEAGGITQQTVFAKVTDNDEVASVRINDVDATFDAIVGQWRAQLPVTIGENPITVVATDTAGNSGQGGVRIYGETGLFANMNGLEWAGGKLYIGVNQDSSSRIVELDLDSGVRRTFSLDFGAVAQLHRGFVLDDSANPTRLFLVQGDSLHVLDLTTGERTLLSSSTESPDIAGTLQLLKNGNGDHLLAFASHADGGRLVRIRSDGSRQLLMSIADFSTAWTFKVSGTDAWLYAVNQARTAGTIVKLDLAGLAAETSSVTPSAQYPVTTDAIAPLTFFDIVNLEVDTGDPEAPRLFLSDSRNVIVMNEDGTGGTRVTGSELGTGPMPVSRSFEDTALSPDGQLYLLDNNWSMVLAVDEATGNRIPVSGHHLGHEPVSNAFPFSTGSYGSPGMSVLQDGRLVIGRLRREAALSGVGIAEYDVETGAWQDLLSGFLGGGTSFDYLPVSSTEFLVGNNRWNPFDRPGFGRVFLDAVSGEWQVEQFSVAGDGKLQPLDGQDWTNLLTAARDSSGDIWVVERSESDEVVLTLWRVDGTTGVRTVVLTLPDTVDGHGFQTGTDNTHQIVFADDGRLFWLADSTNPAMTRLFRIEPTNIEQPVTLIAGASLINGNHDLALDDAMQWVYLAGGSSAAVSVDIVPGATEGDTELLPAVPYPALKHGRFTLNKGNVAFDAERRRLWVFSSSMNTVYLIQPDTGEAVMLPKH